MGDLTGKVALITGAGSGIGRGIAERLARDGAEICIADFDEAGGERTADIVGQLGRGAVNVRCNVAVPAQLEAAVNACVQKYGRLDIAVANAGTGRGAPLLEMTLKDWQDQIDVNLTGVFLTAQACARKMVELGNGGRIVCISSLAAELTGPGIWSYSATKVGVRIMVRGWAQELGQHGINVNAIGPGVIDTPLAAALSGEEGGHVRSNLEARTPVGRVGRPSDIAGLVSFMAGPDGEFMSGSYVIMDGGFRDSSAIGGSQDQETMAERMRIAQAGQARAEEQRRLLDDRD